MSAKPIPQKTIDAVLLDWRVTDLSQRALAAKHKISTGAIGRLCKGVVRDIQPIVSAIVSASMQDRRGIQAHDERMMSAIVSEVNQKVADLERIRACSLIVIDATMQKVEEGNLTMPDLLCAQNVIKVGKENIVGKSPDTAIQINNQNHKPAYESEYLKRIQANFER